MMESETPPTSPLHEAGDTLVSSWSSPDLPTPGAFGSHGGEWKSPAQFDVRSDILTEFLERAALSEEHRPLMSVVLKKISSATSGLNEAFISLLKGFEVLVVKHALGVLPMDSSP